MAKGEYVLFLDADDLLADDALSICGSIAWRTNTDAVLGAISSFDHASGKHTEPFTIQLLYRDAYCKRGKVSMVSGRGFTKKHGTPLE